MSNVLSDLIQRGESGAKNYDAYNRGTYRDSDGRERIRGADRAIDFSGLTLGQVLDAQALDRGAPDRLFAVGRYQIIPQTMKDAAQALRLDRDAPFSDEIQDRIFSEYLITQKRPAIRDYITGEPGATLQSAQLALAREWASIASPGTGRSYYDKPGGANHASISPWEAADALNGMRMAYRQALDAGNQPGQAWSRINPTAARLSGRVEASAERMVGETLGQGAQGDAVAQLQARLAELGYRGQDGRALATDSRFGPQTRSAVERFQLDHGLRVDGVVGAQTREVMDAAREAMSDRLSCPRSQVDAESPSMQTGFLQSLLQAAQSPDPQAMRSALLDLARSPAGQAFVATQPQHPPALTAAPEQITGHDAGPGR